MFPIGVSKRNHSHPLLHHIPLTTNVKIIPPIFADICFAAGKILCIAEATENFLVAHIAKGKFPVNVAALHVFYNLLRGKTEVEHTDGEVEVVYGDVTIVR